MKKSRVLGVVFLIIALIGFVGYLKNPIDTPENGNQASGNFSVAVFFGVISFICFVKSLQNKPKRRKNLASKKEFIGNEDAMMKKSKVTLFSALKLGLYDGWHGTHYGEKYFGETGQSRSISQRKLNYKGASVSLDKIDAMDGWEFERFTAELLEALSYEEVEITAGSNDQGADVLASKDGLRYAIQCKRYNNALNNKPIQEIAVGKAYYGCDIGVVLTTSYFNKNAVAAAEAAGIILWDRDELISMMEKANFIRSNLSKAVITETSNEESSVAAPKALLHQIEELTYDNVKIEIDVESCKSYDILLDDFGLNKDEEEYPDNIDFMFDVSLLKGNVLRRDVSIICNLYQGKRKIATDKTTLYAGQFKGRTSETVYFEAKNAALKCDRIKVYCILDN